MKCIIIGIYAHWGPVSEAFDGADPTRWYDGWHGMRMYDNGKLGENENGVPSNNYLHHIKKYGDPAEFGYKHVIEQFNPSAFDAAERRNEGARRSLLCNSLGDDDL